jgi:hypothetical protein
MKVSGVICKNCNNFIYSRTTHDFRWCPCGKVAVDGGMDYLKIVGNQEDFSFAREEIDATEDDLINDWNTGKDKYGIIPADKLKK